jgi:hypothetical protein
MDPELRAKIDHFVYATPDLPGTIDALAQLLGVRATLGGQHLDHGTRNALIGLGPECYLEIIGPDSELPAPAHPRWFGIDSLGEPRLVAWAARAPSIDDLWRTARAQGLLLGPIAEGKRRRADGSWLCWRYTEPMTNADVAAPFLIDWGESIHPARDAAPGCTLVDFFIQHIDVESARRTLGVLRLHPRVQPGSVSALAAVIDSPNGRVTLR